MRLHIHTRRNAHFSSSVTHRVSPGDSSMRYSFGSVMVACGSLSTICGSLGCAIAVANHAAYREISTEDLILYDSYKMVVLYSIDGVFASSRGDHLVEITGLNAGRRVSSRITRSRVNNHPCFQPRTTLNAEIKNSQHHLELFLSQSTMVLKS